MKTNLIVIFALIGGVIGVVIVRYYFLNALQIIGWNLFWQNLSHLNFDMFRLVFKSATFGKCLTGFLIGGGIGALAGVLLSGGKK